MVVKTSTMKTNQINIAKDFTTTPGARYRTDGHFSGQEFYEDILEPKYISLKDTNEKLIINLDGTEGYATSFLDQAFGQLAKEYGKEVVLNRIEFISMAEPFLIEEIKSYMSDSLIIEQK